MTRFVRIYHDPKDDPGSRIRVEYDPDDTGAFCISDENVLPEKLRDPDCYHVRTIANIEMDRAKARAIRDAMVELCKHLDEEERAAKELEARAVVAATHGVPLSAVQVVTAEPELPANYKPPRGYKRVARCSLKASNLGPRRCVLAAGHELGCSLEPAAGTFISSATWILVPDRAKP